MTMEKANDFMVAVFNWFGEHPEVVATIAVGSLVLALVSVAVVVVAITRMSPDYFVAAKPADASWGQRHPALRILLLVLKTALGLALLITGIAMLVVPGQGLLTILIGLGLMEFPGKRSLERRLVREPHVFNAINWIRTKHNQPPLIAPD